MFAASSPASGAPAYVTPASAAPAGTAAAGFGAPFRQWRQTIPWAVALVAIAAAALIALCDRAGAGPDVQLSVTPPRGTELYG